MFGDRSTDRLARIEEQLVMIREQLVTVHEALDRHVQDTAGLVLRVSQLEWQQRAVFGVVGALVLAMGPVMLDHYLTRQAPSVHEQSQ